MSWHFDDLQRRGEDLQRTIFRLALVAAFVVAGSPLAAAQQTVYVGGSGKLPVEVNLEVINRLTTPSRIQPILDPPGQAPRSAFLLGSAPASAATRLVKPSVTTPTAAALMPLPMPEPKPAPGTTATTASVAPAVSPPLPEPVPAVEPAPLTPVVSEPLPPAETVPAPESMQEPAATPVPAPEPTVAALTPAAAIGDILSIPFTGGSAALPGSAESNLQAVAASLAADDSLRAQVKAYADGTTGSASSARRLSLSRALAVRSVLIEFGVRSTRIDVRALGDRNEGGAPDRVDVLVTNR